MLDTAAKELAKEILEGIDKRFHSFEAKIEIRLTGVEKSERLILQEIKNLNTKLEYHERTNSEEFRKIDAQFKKIDKRFEKLENRMEERFEKVNKKFDIMSERISSVEKNLSNLRADTDMKFSEAVKHNELRVFARKNALDFALS